MTKSFQLGDKVEVFQTLERTRNAGRYKYVWEPRPLFPDPMVGYIMGYRTVWDGDVEYDEGIQFLFDKPHKVYMVSFDMRRKPMYAEEKHIRILQRQE